MKLTILSALLMGITSTLATSQPEISMDHFADMSIYELVLKVTDEYVKDENMRIAKVIAAILEEEEIKKTLEELSLYYETNQAYIDTLNSLIEGMSD